MEDVVLDGGIERDELRGSEAYFAETETEGGND